MYVLEKISIEECVRYGVDFVLGLTQDGPFFGDIVSELSEELKRMHPLADGKTKRIAKSSYWVLMDFMDFNAPLEGFFWVDIYNSSSPVSHEYTRNQREFDRGDFVKKVIDRYGAYILS